MTKTLLFAAALLASTSALAAESEPQKEAQTPPRSVDAQKPASGESAVPPSEERTGRIGQSPFRVRTSRPNYAESEVARPLALQKEWAEFALTYRYREVTQFTDLDGEVQDADYTYQHSWLTLDARYGFTRNLTMYMSIPYAINSYTRGPRDGELSSSGVVDNGMGDVNFGLLWQVVNRESASTLSSVGIQFDTKQPSGNESAGAPGDRHMPLGTGTTNAGLHLHAKQRVGPVAAALRVGYVYKFSAVTMWVRDLEGPLGLNGRFKPGNEITAGGRLILQPIQWVALEGGADYVSRENAAVGPTSDEVSPGEDLVEMRDTEFEALNASARLLIEPSVNWTFVVGAQVPVMSRNSQAFMPLEDLSQSYGTTIIGSTIFRW